MNNTEQLKALANNPALLEAVKEHILSKFDGPVLTEGKDDILLGQIFRARLAGRQSVEEAFRDVERLRVPEKAAQVMNRAR